MSPENKQRIVGVVVLVAFIALLVPFLFASGIKKKLSSVDEIPINAQKRQLITKQIQSINSAAETATVVEAAPVTANQSVSTPAPPVATVAEVPPVPPGLPQDQQFDQQDMLLPPENNQVESLNQSVLTAAPASAEVVAPVKPISKNKVIKKFKAVPKIKTKAKNKNIKSNMSESWSVQVGSFSDEARIQKLLTQLHGKGFHVYTQKIATTTGSLTRVLVGRESSKEKANQIAWQLETTMKIKGHLIRNQK